MLKKYLINKNTNFEIKKVENYRRDWRKGRLKKTPDVHYELYADNKYLGSEYKRKDIIKRRDYYINQGYKLI